MRVFHFLLKYERDSSNRLSVIIEAMTASEASITPHHLIPDKKTLDYGHDCVIYEKEVQLYFLVVNSITIQHLSTRNSDENRAIKVRSSITELKNVDMMAEYTDINVKDKDRQSKDYPNNFSSASITEDSTFDDSSFKCWCHEVFIPNQRPERCSPGLDETPSDKSSERNSISSFNSIDSGYDSIKRTHIYSISKYDECNKQNPLWTSNKTSSTDISTAKVSMSTPVDTPNI